MSDLDRDLEFELHRALDPLSAAPLPPRRLARAHRPARTVLGGAGAALGFKILSGVAVAAAAVTVAGAATTGSLNPTVWGHQVTQQVASCKAQLADGQHGIGDCMSTFANQHGQAVASSARQHGNGNGNGAANGKDKTNNGNGNGSGNGGDKSKSHSPKDPTATTPPTVEIEPTDPSSHGPVHVTPGP